MAAVSVLIPTYERAESLAMTLSGVAAQTVTDLQVVVSSQGRHKAEDSPVARAVGRVIEARGGSVEWHHHEPRGIAEQRQFLLERAEAEPILFLDDDVFMEPWEGPVRPEVVEKDGHGWERWHLHRAANLYHVAQRLDLPPGGFLRYKVAWVGSCVLYSREKLLEVGGFSFWTRLPRYHKAEDIVVQNLLMRRFGGCGVAPSGTYHSEVETTTFSPEGVVDADAFKFLMPELVERYAPETPKPT